MLDFLAEFLVNLFGELLLSAFGQDRGRLGESPIERQQRRFGRWVVGIILFLAVAVGVYVWSSRHL